MGKILVENHKREEALKERAQKREEINKQTSSLMAKSDHKNKYYNADDTERALTDESNIHNYDETSY